MDGGLPPSMLDVAFDVEGEAPARDYRRGLAAALEAALPWLAAEPGAGVHRLNLAVGGQAVLLSRRTRLTLRVPRARAPEVEALAGRVLAVDPGQLRLGRPHRRELLPHGTLYAHLVAATGDADEAGFLEAAESELAALGVHCRANCGRRATLESGTVHGYSLMLDRLSEADSTRVLEAGLGPYRRLGCGLFVPHKSAAAVGAPT